MQKPKTHKSLRELKAEAEARKAKPKVQTLEERVVGLEKKLKTTQEKLKATQTELAQLAGLEKKLKTAQKTQTATQVKLDKFYEDSFDFFSSVVKWSDDVSQQLQELDQAYRNLSDGQSDPGPFDKSSGSLRCILGVLVDQGAQFQLMLRLRGFSNGQYRKA
ncbi:MAG: hypothetical protein ACLPKT_07195 [Methylocella sp.]